MSIHTENFDMIFGAKDNIQALRRKVLDLAFQGKLVEQDSVDETANELLHQVKAGKERLVKEKIIKEKRPMSIIEEEEIPFEIPVGWQWLRIGNIGETIGGGTPKSNINEYWTNDGIPWITPADLGKHKEIYISKGKRDITELGLKKSSANLLPKGTVLFSSRAPIGHIAIAKNEIATNQGFKSIIPYVLEMNKYIYYFMKWDTPRINDEATGTTFKEVSGSIVSNILIPVPPLEEQKKIVEKIEVLLSHIDQVEKHLETKERLQEAFPKAVVTSISNCKNEEELKVELALVIEHFTEVFQTPQSLQKLRDVIIQLGIQGKLLPQNPNDEPAIQLLKQIKIEKEKLIKNKKIKKEKSLPEIESDDIPFEIPDNWEWVKLGDISNKIHYGYTASAKPKGDAKLLRITDIQKGKVNWENVPMCDIVSEKVEQYLLGEDDIVIARTGGTVGKSFIIRDIQGESVFASYLIRVVLTDKRISDYIYQYLYSPMYLNEIQVYSKGTGQPNVNAQNLKNLLIPMPPLKEQHRIATKINSLMKLIDQMESKMSRKVSLVKNMASV